MTTPRRAPWVSTAALADARALLLLTSLAACSHHGPSAPEPLRVAAAADLSRAFPELGAAFTQATGVAVTFSFGSSGQLARQVIEGAPYGVLASADVAFVDQAIAAGACDAASRAVYAEGRIGLWTPADGVAPAASLAALREPRFRRIAIASPEHAPYGRAARQALESAGVWAAVEPRLVYGANVLQALQFAQSGNADVAIVARSLALASGGRFVPIDPSAHRPLVQALTVCARGAAVAPARAFARFVASEPGRAILRRHGFTVPGMESQPVR
jgi:molybdate transport system substrate-binding protein